jgi:diadenosine tetraphosphate (Ap4A) HIT family hydrolase
VAGGVVSGESSCAFCAPEAVVLVGERVYARRDGYPVAPGHLLIVPYRHVADYFDTSAEEQAEILQMVNRAREWLQRVYAPDGFNIGVNSGVAAGQTVLHAHVHLIPRYRGDMEDPAGGVRGVIPGKQKYRQHRARNVPGPNPGSASPEAPRSRRRARGLGFMIASRQPEILP